MSLPPMGLLPASAAVPPEPSLYAQQTDSGYRGHCTDGTYEFNYNWYDPADDCTGDMPCDNDGHGTHALGTMVGDDGTGNVVGVALMWSASPDIRGDVAETERLLDSTAADTVDPSCGGTAAHNNVGGEGKLDADAAVMATPRGPLGALTGTVTAEGKLLAGATPTSRWRQAAHTPR